MFIIWLVLVWGVPGTAWGGRPCPRTTTRTELDSQFGFVRKLVMDGDYETAEVFLERLEGLLTCTEVPVVGRWLAQKFFLDAVTAWHLGRRDEVEGLLEDVVAAYRMFEWDVGLVPPRENPVLYKAYRVAKAKVLVQSAPALFEVVTGDRYGLVYVDGQSFVASPGEQHFIRPGRHIVQFQVGDNSFYGNIQDFRAGGVPLVITAPREVFSWDRSVEVSGEFLFFPAPHMDVSRGEMGVNVAVGAARDRVRLGGFLGVYPGRMASDVGTLYEEQAGEALGAPMARVGGLVVWTPGGEGVWRVGRPGLGILVGGLYAPYDLVLWSSEGEEASRLYLMPSVGGHVSARAEFYHRSNWMTAMLALEGGFALLAGVGPGGVTGWSGTPLAGVTIMVGYAF